MASRISVGVQSPHFVKPQIVKTYVYTDEQGNDLFEVLRYEPKDFRQRHKGPDGNYIYSLKGVRRVLYNLPAIVQSKGMVFLCEGEKDADNVIALGLVGTTAPMGASAAKWEGSEFAETLRGRHVVIFPDNDQIGLTYAKLVRIALEGIAKTVSLVMLPELPSKGDISDWLAMPGNDREKLLDLVMAMIDSEREAADAGEAPRGDAYEGPSATSSNGNGKHAPPATKTRRLGTLLSEVRPSKVNWLWAGRIPLGKLTVLDGDPGLGKSAMTLDIAARVTRGWPMPDELQSLQGKPCRSPAGVVLLSAEDGIEDTIVPRLEAVGANRKLILALDKIPDAGGARLPVLPQDCEFLRQAIEQMDADLVIIDPLNAFLSGDVKTHNDQDVRRALHQMSEVATESGAAIVIVRHLNKNSGGEAIYRGGGSIGIIGAARSGLLVAKDKTCERIRVLASIKCNLAMEVPSLNFELVSTEQGTVQISWTGKSMLSAADLLSRPDGDVDQTPQIQEACDFLLDVLRCGPMRATDVISEGKTKAGVSEPTLKRAKAKLGIKSEKAGSGPDAFWQWKLAAAVQGYQPPTVDTLQQIDFPKA